MKKLLSLVIVAAALGASVGCDDKKTSAKTPNTTSPPGGSSSPSKAGP